MSDRWIRWVGTISYLIGMCLTAANIYPTNLYFVVVGGSFWLWAGIRVKDKPLIAVEAAATFVAILGLLSTWVV